MAIPVQIINPVDLPCECMTPPFKCTVNNLASLPPCSINGQVYTVLSDPEFCGPFQVHCRNGQWYALVERSKVYGKYGYSPTATLTILIAPDTQFPVPIDTTIFQNRSILQTNGSGYPVMQVPADRDYYMVQVWANINTPIGLSATRGAGSAHLFTNIPIGQTQFQINYLSMQMQPTVAPWQFPNPSFQATMGYPNAVTGTQFWPFLENETDEDMEVGFFGCSIIGYDLCPKPVTELL